MSPLLDQVYDYVQHNPGVVVGACLAVLLVGITQVIVTSSSSSSSSALHTDNYTPFPLIERRSVSHNTRIFRYALPSDMATLGLPLGHHISLRTTVDGKEIRRPYTPISSDETRGYFELLVKVYPEPYGLMSRHLDSMRLGEAIDVRGPLGRFSYKRNAYRKIHMVCGGTGITPMWQVFRAILADVSDFTNISLIFANMTEDDILLRDELDHLDASEDRFSLYYVLDNPPEEWTGGVGYVTKDMLLKVFGPADSQSMVLMCGPPPMNRAVKANLSDLGYQDSQIFKF